MTLSSYNHGITEGKVSSIKNGESFCALIDGKIICSMSSGGCHYFPNQLQAEVFARRYVDGYTSGSFLSSDVDNFIIDEEFISSLKNK